MPGNFYNFVIEEIKFCKPTSEPITAHTQAAIRHDVGQCRLPNLFCDEKGVLTRHTSVTDSQTAALSVVNNQQRSRILNTWHPILSRPRV